MLDQGGAVRPEEYLHVRAIWVGVAALVEGFLGGSKLLPCGIGILVVSDLDLAASGVLFAVVIVFNVLEFWCTSDDLNTDIGIINWSGLFRQPKLVTLVVQGIMNWFEVTESHKVIWWSQASCFNGVLVYIFLCKWFDSGHALLHD